MFNEKKTQTSDSEALYDFSEDADEVVQDVMFKIGEMAKKIPYTGRVIVNMTFIYPSPTTHQQNCMSEISVHINTDMEINDEEIEARFEQCLTAITNQHKEPEANNLYKCEDTYAIYVPVNSAFGNQDSCVKFSFWAPDTDAGRFIGESIAKTEEFWLCFIKNTTIQ